MAALFMMIVIMIPLYLFLIWTYLYPEDVLLLGWNWQYKEEPTPSEEKIRYTKFNALITMIGLPIILVSIFTDVYVLRFSLVLFPLILFWGGIKIYLSDD